MKSLSFIFVLSLYFLTVHINGDSKQWNHTNFHQGIISNVTLPWIFRNQSLAQAILSGEDQAKLCLKDIDKCEEEDLNYEAATTLISRVISFATQPFDLDQNKNVSQLCRQHGGKYLADLKKFKLWALKMYDSTAKLPSGILSGNVNQLGDFDMCLQSYEKYDKIRGQYCLASMQIQPGISSPYFSALHRLAQSHFHFKSELDDPGHRVPQFSSVKWALCVPNSCSAQDVELAISAFLQELTENVDISIRVKVDPAMCQSLQKEEIPSSTIIALWIFGGIILLEVGATAYDYIALERNEWIMAFSLRKNFNSLISMKRSADDIEVIHGVRFLNAFLLLLAHKAMAMFFIPYVNRTAMVEYLAQPWTVLGRAASLYTDPFIMLSGTLTAYSLLGKLQRNGKLNIVEEYISRLLRIVPSFAALIAFCTLILPWMNSGPMWNLVVTHHSAICKQNWWRNLLFIHNYFGFENMCLTHTHHIGIDTQLFIVSPFFIWLFWKIPRRGGLILLTLALASTLWRYYVTYSMGLSNYVHFGTSIKQLFDTADYMYNIPVHRATVYIMGIFLGYILRNYPHIILSKTQLRIGNTLAVFAFCSAFFGPAFMGSINYIYNPIDAAWYAAFAPILWCFSFAWTIFTGHLGNGGTINRFFSRPIFSIWTKISYTVYLTQFPIFFFNVGIARTAEHFEFFRIILNVKEYVWVIVLAVLLTLLFESPFQNIRNLIFKKKEVSSKDPINEKKIK